MRLCGLPDATRQQARFPGLLLFNIGVLVQKTTESKKMSGSLDVAGELDYSQRPVPPSGRMPRFNLTMAFWAICSAMFFLIVSATLAQTYGTANAIIGLVLTVICYSMINSIIVRYAIKTGLSVSLFSRLLFGRVGSAIATFIYAVCSIYYAVFEGSVVAKAATFYFSGLPIQITQVPYLFLVMRRG
jgi:hypothetical protein